MMRSFGVTWGITSNCITACLKEVEVAPELEAS